MSRHSRCAIGLAVLLSAAPARARFVYSADGSGKPYDYLRTPFGLELPDCGHMVPHITEVFDDELQKNVFVFHAHVNLDDDRCRGKDRQRTEIRGHIPDLEGRMGATTYYRWKFKLAAGFQSSGSFTHIFQLKSAQGAPIMTLTPRSGNLSIDGRVGVRGTTSLDKFAGTWVVADLKIFFANAGKIDLTIKRWSDGEVLFSHSGAADTWDDGSGGHDPKWGIYRSLNNKGALRDEQVRFADFCISHDSATDCDGDGPPTPIGPPPDGGSAPPPADTAVPPPPGLADAATPATVPPAPAADARPVPGPQPEPEPGKPSHPATSGCSVGAGIPPGWGLLGLTLWLARRSRRCHKR